MSRRDHKTDQPGEDHEGHHAGLQKNKVIARCRFRKSECVISTCVFFHQRHFNFKNLEFTGPKPAPLQRRSAPSQQCPPGNRSVPAGMPCLTADFFRLPATGGTECRPPIAHFVKKGEVFSPPRPSHDYFMRGSCSHWWNGGGEDSCHSSVVAPSPQGFAPASRFFANASKTL